MGIFGGLGNLLGGITKAVSPITSFMGGPAGQLIGTLASGFLSGGGKGGGQSPVSAAMPYMQQIPQQTMAELMPYIQRMEKEHAEDRARTLQSQQQLLGMPGREIPSYYKSMEADPQQYINNILAQYQPSQEYQTKAHEMGGAIGNTAAAGGFRGTPVEQRQQADMIRELLGSDMGDYLNRFIQTRAQGLAGEQGLEESNRMDKINALRAQMGYGAGGEGLAQELAQMRGTNLQSIAGMMYSGQREANLNNAYNRERRAAMFQSLFNPQTSQQPGVFPGQCPGGVCGVSRPSDVAPRALGYQDYPGVTL